MDVFSALLGQSGNAYISTCVDAHTPAMAKKYGIDFDALWHTDPVVRELRLFTLDDSYPFDEEQSAKRMFVRMHMDFFYTSDLVVNERAAVELYPRISEWLGHTEDHWAPGRAMAAKLKARGLPAPAWPPKGES